MMTIDICLLLRVKGNK